MTASRCLIILVMVGGLVACSAPTPAPPLPNRDSAMGSNPNPQPSEPVVAGTGTIVYVDLEGGFYALDADNGRRYEPTNLPADFRHHGLRVRFRGRVRTDMVSIRMVGPILEILEIQRL